MAKSWGIEKLFDPLPDRLILEILLLFIIVTIACFLALSFKAFDLIVELCKQYECYDLNKFIIISLILFFTLLLFSIRRWYEYKKEMRLRLRAEKALKEANRKLMLLTRITRHDIKNIIQGIYLYSEIIGYSEDNETKKNALIIKNEAEAIEKLIDFTKIYEQLGSIEAQWYNLAAAFKEVEFSEEFAAIHFDTTSCDVEIYTDPLFSKAIYNLIENAVRHGEHTTKITITCDKGPEDSLLIHCRDNGVGIPEDMKSSIFHEGFGKNTGLGLFLIQEILSITQISIAEVGTEGEGADFLISVPAGHWKK